MKKLVFIPIMILIINSVTACAFVNSFFFPADLRGGTGSSRSSSPSSGSLDYFSPDIGTLKYIPAGTFQYDGTAGNTNIISTAFHMSQYDITRAEFSNVVGFDPSSAVQSTGPNDPVQEVDWYMAIYFCNKLSMMEGLTPVYTVNGSTDPASWPGGTNIPIVNNTFYSNATVNWSANGYRLPTEMEWMWAAMGATNDSKSGDMAGGVNTGGYNKIFTGYNGVNNISNYVWFSDDSTNTTHPIGTKLPNELGLYDMSGNVWQWCWDWFLGYPGGPLTDYRGAASGASRVLRGGTCFLPASYVAVDYRGANDYPCNRDHDYGFRVVRP